MHSDLFSRQALLLEDDLNTDQCTRMPARTASTSDSAYFQDCKAVTNKWRYRIGHNCIRCRGSSPLRRILNRTAVCLPILALILLGIIHFLEALLGRSRILWNSKTYKYDPEQIDWSKPGFEGNDLGNVDTRNIRPIPCHSHNDYLRDAPLISAISWGCFSVEADVWAYDNELYIGHTASSLNVDRTLRTVYIEPLTELLDVKNNRQMPAHALRCGIFEVDPSQTLVLLIDFKQPDEDVFDLVYHSLEPLRSRKYLTYWNGHTLVSGPITVVLTGDAPFERIEQQSRHRDMLYDAPLHALSEMYNTSNSYYASTDFKTAIGTVWRGHLSTEQMAILRSQIALAKDAGLKARYWGTPFWPVSLRNHVWHVLVKEGADVLNIDDLKAVELYW